MVLKKQKNNLEGPDFFVGAEGAEGLFFELAILNFRTHEKIIFFDKKVEIFFSASFLDCNQNDLKKPSNLTI